MSYFLDVKRFPGVVDEPREDRFREVWTNFRRAQKHHPVFLGEAVLYQMPNELGAGCGPMAIFRFAASCDGTGQNIEIPCVAVQLLVRKLIVEIP